MKTNVKKKKPMKRALVLLLAVSLILPLSSCGSFRKFTRTDMTLFDTETIIVGYDKSQEDFDAKANKIIDMLTRYHKLFDIYNEYSNMNNLKTVNDKAGKESVSVSNEIIELIEFGRKMHKLTRGNMNIAMGSVTKIWHQYREEGKAVPPMEELKAAEEHTDIRNVICNSETGTVTFSDPQLSLDVGAVAKGYATEMAAQMIEENGWTRMALSVGGNIRTVGTKDDGKPWATGIQNPIEGASEAIAGKVYLVDKAAVTSGSYQRYYDVDGVRYHHIIDPETLMPKNIYLSVTVIYRDSGVADALSTALFNITETEGRKILKKIGAEAMWIYPDGDINVTSGFLSERG